MFKQEKFSVVYEDDYFVVVDKPSSLLVVPVQLEEENNLTSLLNKKLQEQGTAIKAHPCHRLDKETSGLVIFAKGKAMQKIVMEEFRQHKVRKTYIAFVQGRLDKTEGQLKSYLKDAWPYAKNQKGKLAISKYRVLYRTCDFSVLKIEPVTGRKNQIRIQFKDIGHPLLGERRFAFAKDWKVKFKRVALHAYALEFVHPVDKNKIILKSPLPLDMGLFLKRYGLDSSFVYTRL